MRRAVTLVLLPAPLLLTAPSLAGCGHGCTEAGCLDGVTISLPADLEPGHYELQLDADGMSWTCEAIVPVVEAPTRSGWDVSVLRDGAALRGLRLDWAPGTDITVRVSRDGSELAARTFAPRYENVRPNGEDCEPVCQVASTSITLEET